MSLRRSARITKSISVSIPVQQASQVATAQKLLKRKADEDVYNSNKKPKKAGIAVKSTSNTKKLQKLVDPLPQAPAKSLPRSKASKVESSAPAPSLVNIARVPYSTGDIDDATPPPELSERLADPHVTNATLVTSDGRKVTALPSRAHARKTSKNTISSNAPTTNTLLEKAQAHLISVDARFAQLIPKQKCAIFSLEGLNEEIDPFRSLVSGICGQQVSGAAAKSIKNKFVGLFNEGDVDVHVWPTPAKVAETSIEKLRTAGLSQRKAEYIQGLAEKFVSGELSTTMLLQASDEEVMEKLIAVRGLGKWSVEMFACFGLKRMDILSTGDLGVQKGMAVWDGKDVAKLKGKGGKWKYMSEADMLAKSEPYAPYRSLFMWYMWRVADVDIAVLTAEPEPELGSG